MSRFSPCMWSAAHSCSAVRPRLPANSIASAVPTLIGENTTFVEGSRAAIT